MDTQRAIAKVLQDFTSELLKVFSAAVIDAVHQVDVATRSSGASLGASVAEAPRRGRPRKDAARVAPAAPAPKATRPVARSTPAVVSQLGERIVALLGGSTEPLAARDIMASLKLNEDEQGRFEYALGKLKKSGSVVQFGERGQARYGVGGAPKVKRGPGRPRKVPLAEGASA